eukprot:1563136-Amphidinium_carterae.1
MEEAVSHPAHGQCGCGLHDLAVSWPPGRVVQPRSASLARLTHGETDADVHWATLDLSSCVPPE